MEKWNKENWENSTEYFKSSYPFENGPVHNAIQWGPIFYEELGDWKIVIKSIDLIIRSMTIPNASAIPNINTRYEYSENMCRFASRT